MMDDISKYVIHWTSGNSYEQAFENLYCILNEHRIFGSSNKIKGGFKCICFTERPAKYFDFEKRYKPFGIALAKKYLFELGGRPVIYQPDADYEILPDDLQWRHVLYNPCETPPKDFTWEREWRIKTDELPLDHQEVIIVVPKGWKQKIIDRYGFQESNRYEWECDGYRNPYARPPDPFLYTIKILRRT
jgi:hypothetical protein